MSTTKTTPTRTKRDGSALLASVVATALLLGAGIGTTLYVNANGIHLRKLSIMPEGDLAVHTLPKSYPSWEAVGVDQILSKEGIEALGTENFLTRTYVAHPESTIAREMLGDEEGVLSVSLHLAYYTGMVDTVPHVPERCFVGAGVEMTGASRSVEIPFDRSKLIPDNSVPGEVLEAMDADGGAIMLARSPTSHLRERLPPNLDNLSMRVTPFYDAVNRTSMIAGYFFVANGEIVPSADQVRLKAFELEDDYAFYLKVQFTSSSVDTPEELALVAGSMLDEMFADLMRRTPDWVEVRRGTYPASDETES